MLNLSRIKYYLYYYRYNILVPSIIGGIILLDYLKLKKKRALALRQAESAEKKHLS